MQKRWTVAEPVSSDFIQQFPQYEPLVLQLLHNRGILTEEEMTAFLEPDYEQGIADPFLFDDMEKAVRRIIAAINDQELIGIYGDYDVDGICASTVLFDTLTLLGAKLDVYLPHREKEGYGLRKAALEELAGRGAKVVISDDMGIMNAAEVAHGNTFGLDIIITDHHQAPEDPANYPPAFAIIHPRVHADRYPFKHLCGAGTAFKVAQGMLAADWDPEFSARRSAVIDTEGKPMNWPAYEKWLLDIVCMATITDCVPLTGENRLIVKYGLIVLNKTRRVGLKALLRSAKYGDKTIDTQTIGFTLGPRINAASRMEHASIAFRLMTEKDDAAADNIAALLEKTNIDRQKLSERVTTEALAAGKKLFEAGKKILIAQGEGWPIGVLGLVAGRVMNKFHRPVLLASITEEGRDGTARSVHPFNVANALTAHPQFFTRAGGHAMAGGFALKPETDFEEFKTALETYAEEHIIVDSLVPCITIDSEITIDQIGWSLWESVQKFAPHGQGNPAPQFLLSSIKIIEIRGVGKNNKHLKLTLQQNGRIKRGIAFSFGLLCEELIPGDLLDLVCELSVNEWNGSRELELNITDVRHVACTMTGTRLPRIETISETTATVV